MSAQVEVLDSPAIDELVEVIRTEYLGFERDGISLVQRAIKVGDALLQAKELVGGNGWYKWIDFNMPFDRVACGLFMRVARYKEVIYEAETPVTTIRQAQELLVGLPVVGRGRIRKLQPEATEVIQELRAEGLTVPAIAAQFGVSERTVYRLQESDGQKTKRAQEAAVKREAAKKAIQEIRQRRERELARKLARTRGGGIQEAYSLAERLQDALGRARLEASDNESRDALRRASTSHHQTRDEIVRVLGAA